MSITPCHARTRPRCCLPNPGCCTGCTNASKEEQETLRRKLWLDSQETSNGHKRSCICILTCIGILTWLEYHQPECFLHIMWIPGLAPTAVHHLVHHGNRPDLNLIDYVAEWTGRRTRSGRFPGIGNQTFTLANLTFGYFLFRPSKTGCIILHGPHRSAQKSTSPSRVSP